MLHHLWVTQKYSFGRLINERTFQQEPRKMAGRNMLQQPVPLHNPSDTPLKVLLSGHQIFANEESYNTKLLPITQTN